MSKITMQHVQDRITLVEFSVVGLSTHCMIRLDNGFQIDGVSHCADPADFTEAAGRIYSFKDAVSKGISYLVFARCEDHHINS